MCIYAAYYLHCTQCRREFNYNGQTFFESPEEVAELANEQGWGCHVRVRNGSDWDFCTECYPNHQFLEKQLEREEKTKEKVIDININYSNQVISIQLKDGHKEIKDKEFTEFTSKLFKICDEVGLEYEKEMTFSVALDYI